MWAWSIPGVSGLEPDKLNAFKKGVLNVSKNVLKETADKPSGPTLLPDFRFLTASLNSCWVIRPFKLLEDSGEIPLGQCFSRNFFILVWRSLMKDVGLIGLSIL